MYILCKSESSVSVNPVNFNKLVMFLLIIYRMIHIYHIISVLGLITIPFYILFMISFRY